jgi:hypothetical protein
MPNYPSVDESRAGWSVGEIATAASWLVTGKNGANLLRAKGAGQAETWWRTCERARAVGMLAPPTGTVIRAGLLAP